MPVPFDPFSPCFHALDSSGQFRVSLGSEPFCLVRAALKWFLMRAGFTAGFEIKWDLQCIKGRGSFAAFSCVQNLARDPSPCFLSPSIALISGGIKRKGFVSAAGLACTGQLV